MMSKFIKNNHLNDEAAFAGAINEAFGLLAK